MTLEGREQLWYKYRSQVKKDWLAQLFSDAVVSVSYNDTTHTHTHAPTYAPAFIVKWKSLQLHDGWQKSLFKTSLLVLRIVP